MRLLALALVTLVPAASAQPQVGAGQVEARLADLRLATAVRLALVDDARTRALDVRVVARDGGVEVSGDVPPAMRATVGAVARDVRGVRVVGGLGALVDQGAPPLRVAPTPRSEARGSQPEPAESGPQYHRVERGDTLFSLARRYETTVGAILDLNGMDGTSIRVGQRVRVR